MVEVFLIIGVIIFIITTFFVGKIQADEIKPAPHNENSQSLALLSPGFAVVIPDAIGGPVYTHYRNDILVADTGSLAGNVSFKQIEDTNGVSLYIVRSGDTLSEIAELFDVSVNTIKWENDLGKTLKVGQELRILPVTGVSHTIKKGETFGKIAAKYEVEIEDITIFNDLDATKLKIGQDIIVPNGVKQAAVKKSTKSTYTRSSSSSSKTYTKSSSAQPGYYAKPANGRTSSLFGPRSGGYHYGIDLANSIGTPIVAAASGTVIKVRNYCTDNSGRSSCGGGYGNHLIIQHDNGTQTLYGHAKRVIVANGAKVKQGQKIAEIGNTGRSSGSHVHFEIIKSNGQKMNPNNLF